MSPLSRKAVQNLDSTNRSKRKAEDDPKVSGQTDILKVPNKKLRRQVRVQSQKITKWFSPDPKSLKEAHKDR